MKILKNTLLALSVTLAYGLTSCEKHDHSHSGHTHDDGNVHKHAEGEDHEHDHDHEHGHSHGEPIVAGPSGGRVLTKVEPHLEMFISDDRKVHINQVSDDLKIVPIGTQVVSLIAGDRSSPTELSFTKSGDKLVSNEVLPSGNNFPVVIEIKKDADDKNKKREKFNLNLADCPSCDNKEYACECEHEH